MRLVDCCCEGRLDWELPSPPIEGILVGLGDEDYPGDQHSPVAARHHTLQDLVVNCCLKHQLGSIAQSFSGVDVPEEHEEIHWVSGCVDIPR